MRFELSDRDRLVMQTISLLNQASTAHLKSLVFHDVSRVSMDRCLRRLKAQRLIKKLGVRAAGYRRGTPPAIYVLDHKGWWYLNREGNFPTVTAVSEHALHVSDIYTGLVEADREGRIKLMPETRLEKGIENMRIDIYVDLVLPSAKRRRRIYVEVQENARPAVINEKLTHHWTAFETSVLEPGKKYPPVAFVAKDEYVQFRIKRLIPDHMKELFSVHGVEEFVEYATRQATSPDATKTPEPVG